MTTFSDSFVNAFYWSLPGWPSTDKEADELFACFIAGGEL